MQIILTPAAAADSIIVEILWCKDSICKRRIKFQVSGKNVLWFVFSWISFNANLFSKFDKIKNELILDLPTSCHVLPSCVCVDLP